MNLADLQSGDDSRRNWKRINEAMAYLRLREKEENRLRDAIEDLRRTLGRDIIERWPFRVYTRPPSLRPTGQKDADWWRKFTVQHGYVNNVKTSACDDADGEGTSALEIPVPSGLDIYYIWVESTWDGSKVTANAIQSGAAPWTGFPGSQPAGKINTLLATIDTLSNVSVKQSLVRQFVYQDITITAGGGGGGVDYLGEWTMFNAYSPKNLVRISAGVAAGSYLCTKAVPLIPSPGAPSICPNDALPWLGVYWTMIGRVVDQSNWI